jgi:glycerol uptake facilitator-like aquaporin
MKKTAAEFFGTFVLVFAGTGAIVINEVSGGAVTHAGIALTFGLIVLAMIYTVGDVSGAHLNPAVTIGFFAAGRFTAGIAIGSVIGLEAMFAGPICGVSMNPARSFAPALVSMHFQSLWIYLIAPVCGALLAVPICRLIRDDQCCRVRFLEREFRGQIENEEM